MNRYFRLPRTLGVIAIGCLLQSVSANTLADHEYDTFNKHSGLQIALGALATYAILDSLEYDAKFTHAHKPRVRHEHRHPKHGSKHHYKKHHHKKHHYKKYGHHKHPARRYVHKRHSYQPTFYKHAYDKHAHHKTYRVPRYVRDHGHVHPNRYPAHKRPGKHSHDHRANDNAQRRGWYGDDWRDRVIRY